MKKSILTDTLITLKDAIADEVAGLDDAMFDQVIGLWHGVSAALKDAVYDSRNSCSRHEFEDGKEAQSLQFAIECLPEFHRILRTYYNRRDHLLMLDVGAESGAGSNLFALLHSGRRIYSKLTIDTIDYVDLYIRWIKALYPKLSSGQRDVAELPRQHWDLVFCSHVIEHVADPRRFLEQLIPLCKGFLFIYAPYQETRRIPAHLHSIDESLFVGLNVERIMVQDSMAWHADIPEDKCILAVLDCRI